MSKENAPVFLLTGTDLSLVRRVENVIDRCLTSFGLSDIHGDFELSEAQLAEIDARMRTARLSPATCAKKLHTIMGRPYFCLMRVWEPNEKGFVWNVSRSDAKTVMDLPIIEKIPLDSPANFILQAISIEESFTAVDIETVRDYLDLNDYAYLPLGDRGKILLDLDICEAIEQQPELSPKPTTKLSRLQASNGNYMFFPSRKGYTEAFLPVENETAYITTLDDDFIDRLDFHDGQATGEDAVPITVRDLKKGAEGIVQEDYDLPLIAAIYRNRWEALSQKARTSPIEIGTPFSLPRKSLGEFMHTDYEAVRTDEDGMPTAITTAGSHRENPVAAIKRFENKVGVTENKSFYRILTLQGYDSRADAFILTAPYLDLIALELQRGAGSTRTPLPANNFLIHSTANATRNRRALELVMRISSGLLQRGEEIYSEEEKRELKKAQKSGVNKKDLSKMKADMLQDPDREPPPTVYEPTFAFLVDLAPSLKARLDEARKAPSNSRQLVNNALKSAFSGAYKMLKKETDCYKYFLDLQIPEIYPTVSTLNSTLRITFRGINPKYKQKK